MGEGLKRARTAAKATRPTRPLKELAKKIADELFVNGIGQRAERLVLESADKKDLGGWCFEAVVKVVLTALQF